MLRIQLLVSVVMLLTSVTSFNHHHYHANMVSAAPPTDEYPSPPATDEAYKGDASPGGKSAGDQANSGAKKDGDYGMLLSRDTVQVYNTGRELPSPFTANTLESNDNSVVVRVPASIVDDGTARKKAVQATLITGVNGAAPIQGYMYCPSNKTVISPEVLKQVYDLKDSSPVGLEARFAPMVAFETKPYGKPEHCVFVKAPWQLQPDKAIFDPSSVGFEQLNAGLSAISKLASMLTVLSELDKNIGFSPLMFDHMYRDSVADEPASYANDKPSFRMAANVPVLLTGELDAHQLLDGALDRYSAYINRMISDDLDKKGPGLHQTIRTRITQTNSMKDLKGKITSLHAVTQEHRQYLIDAGYLKPATY